MNLLDPLPGMDADAAEVWMELAPALVKSGKLHKTTAARFFILCNATAKAREIRATVSQHRGTKHFARAAQCAANFERLAGDLREGVFGLPRADVGPEKR